MKDYSVLLSCGEATMAVIHDAFDKGYQQGYKYGKKIYSCDNKDMDAEYNRGLNDAWEVIQKISSDYREGGYTCKILVDIFGTSYTCDIVQKYAPQDAIRMIKEYEDKQKQFAVGDEVYSDAFDDKGIITHITDDKVSCVCIICNGSTMMKVGINGLHKTGRHFDAIAEVLAEMRGEE